MSSENEQENKSYYDTSSSIQQELPLFKPGAKAQKDADGEKAPTLLIKKEPNLDKVIAKETTVTDTPTPTPTLLLKKPAPQSSPLILKSAASLAEEAKEESSDLNNPIETGSFKDEFETEIPEEDKFSDQEEYFEKLEEEFSEEEEASPKVSPALILKSNEQIQLKSSEEEIQEEQAAVENEPEQEDSTRLLLKKVSSYVQEEEEQSEKSKEVEKTELEDSEQENANELIDDTLNAPKKIVTLQEFPRREVEDISDSFRLDSEETKTPDDAAKKKEPVKSFTTLDNATIGEILSEAREQHEMTVDEVVQSTRIRHTFVNALENNILEDLPEKVYTLGYIRQLCREYSIPHQEVTDTYLKQRGDDLSTNYSQQTVSLEQDDVANSASNPGGKITNILMAFVVVAILAFLSFAGYKKISQPTVDSTVTAEELEDLDYSHFRLPIDLPLIKLEVPNK